jgi:hypothetical protein
MNYVSYSNSFVQNFSIFTFITIYGVMFSIYILYVIILCAKIQPRSIICATVKFLALALSHSLLLLDLT